MAVRRVFTPQIILNRYWSISMIRERRCSKTTKTCAKRWWPWTTSYQSHTANSKLLVCFFQVNCIVAWHLMFKATKRAYLVNFTLSHLPWYANPISCQCHWCLFLSLQQLNLTPLAVPALNCVAPLQLRDAPEPVQSDVDVETELYIGFAAPTGSRVGPSNQLIDATAPGRRAPSN
jgi:hypothetical protein